MTKLIAELFQTIEIPFFFLALMVLTNTYMGFLIGQNYELTRKRRKED